MKTWELFTSFLLIMSSLHVQQSTAAPAHDHDQAKLYVVYLGKNIHDTVEDTHAHHHQILSNVFDSKESVLECLIYHYKHGFNGFSAMLTPSQAEIVAQLPEVVSVFQSGISKLHTTRSWTYLGLDQTTGVWPDAKFGENVIIGVFDTGIWPESLSFDDTGLTPVPTRWKGQCVNDTDFDASVACNNKLIGARFFFSGYERQHNDTANIIQSSRDYEGHGTHTASTMAGARVENVDFFGLAPGTAVGGAPSAKLAVYKVCWTRGCSDADILAAFDQAIQDGVDIISASLGAGVRPLYTDSVAIGSYHAIGQGILVCQSAGNNGPFLGTVGSTAPWLLTIGASTVDRKFLSDVVLGDGTIIEGVTVNLHTRFAEEEKVLTDGAAIRADGFTVNSSRSCIPGSLNSSLAADKVIVCYQDISYTQPNGTLASYTVDDTVSEAGGYGTIVAFAGLTTRVLGFDELYGIFQANITGSGFGLAEASNVETYISSTTNPTATMKQAKTVVNVSRTTGIAEFSSRGPNLLLPFILKPDLVAPGVSILAAWTGSVNPGSDPVDYKIVSGTSMACPHVAGASALIKSLHPTWSPAAIKSALMTTAKILTGETIYSTGAGEMDIVKAADPGLIYNLTETDYRDFVCSTNLTAKNFTSITGKNISTCPTPVPNPWDLNYPTITVGMYENSTIVTRKVTNVGDAVSTYSASLREPLGVSISVDPTMLNFTRVGEVQTFTVSVHIVNQTLLSPRVGTLSWTDGTHTVNSHIFISDLSQIVFANGF